MAGLMTHDLRLRDTTLVSSRSIYVALAIVVLTAIWFSLPVGRPLSSPDEGRYAEIPREMLVSGDWVTPRLNDLAYLEKPPLQYWATTLSYRLFGTNEWSARLCMTLSAWLDVLLVFLLGRRLWGVRTGVIAAALLASTAMHFVMGQVLTLDMTFTFLLTATLCAFCMAQIHRKNVHQCLNGWMLVSWVMLALATLTKGLVAPVIVGVTVTIYMCWQRDWAVWRTLHLGPGLSLFLLITVPWFVLVARTNPDFLQFFFIHEHLQRYATESAHRVEPWWYFVAILAAGVLPWLWQMIASLTQGWRATTAPGRFDVLRLLWVWCIFVLVFFSLSGSKLAPHILPVLPPLALLTAARASSGLMRWLDVSAWILLAGAIVLIAYTLIAPSAADDPVVRSIAYEMRPIALVYAVIAAVAALFYRLAASKKQPVYSVVSLAAGWFLGFALLFATVGHDGSLRSGRSLAAAIPAELADAEIFSVKTYDQSLPFYLRRTLVLADYRGELDYGLQREPVKVIDMPGFERRWRAASRAVAIMSNETYAEQAAHGLPMRVLGKDRHRVAVSRQ